MKLGNIAIDKDRLAAILNLPVSELVQWFRQIEDQNPSEAKRTAYWARILTDTLQGKDLATQHKNGLVWLKDLQRSARTEGYQEAKRQMQAQLLKLIDI